jgi:hypothetical protein
VKERKKRGKRPRLAGPSKLAGCTQGREKKGEERGCGPGCRGRKRKEGRGGRWPAGLGPKEKRGRGKRKEEKNKMHLNLKLKFEFKRKTTKISMQRA